MDLVPSPVIHDVLPSEILALIFEEHARLEWRAPTVDERVCRLWRKIVRNAPRVWAYLEIDDHPRFRRKEFRSWLHRSGTAPLHIRVENFALANHGMVSDLLGQYHTRIASLRMVFGDYSLFRGREFPRLRFLSVERWCLPHTSLYTVLLGSMPQLRSLCAGPIDFCVVPWSELALLEVLALWDTSYTLLQQHSQSLTTLMLDDVTLADAISGPVDFPVLTYLSLCNVISLKPHVNTPRLVTYHERGDTQREPFPAPIQSLVEYGVYGLESGGLGWCHSFPNLSRLSIRADPPVLISFLDSLSDHPHSLPAVQIISAGTMKQWDVRLTKEDQEIMKSKVHDLDVALRFERGKPFYIPIFFGEVCDCPINDL